LASGQVSDVYDLNGVQMCTPPLPPEPASAVPSLYHQLQPCPVIIPTAIEG